MKIAFSILAVFILIAVAFVGYGREKSWALFFGNPDLGAKDFSSFERTSNPHDSLICSPGLCEGAKVDQVFEPIATEPKALIEAIDAAVVASDYIGTRVDDRSDPAYARYVFHSPLMRYPDTVEFKAEAMEDGKTGLIAYARAQVGRSDFGANLARLKSILEAARL